MRFADESALKAHNCNKCHELTKKQRNCMDDGFNNLKRERKMSKESLSLSFCHAKALWYDTPSRLFESCYVAMETGILPKSGGLEDQDDIFVECFSFFVDYYKSKEKRRNWTDIVELVKISLESLAKMFSKLFGGK